MTNVSVCILHKIGHRADSDGHGSRLFSVTSADIHLPAASPQAGASIYPKNRPTSGQTLITGDTPSITDNPPPVPTTAGRLIAQLIQGKRRPRS